MKLSNVFLALFVLVGLTDTLYWVWEIPMMHTIAKPLIMPVLMAYVIYDSASRKNFDSKNMILLFSLLLYWGGDTIVMINKDISFVGALGLLLLGMIVSIYAFFVASDKMKLKPILVVPYLVYGVAYILLILPKLGSFAPATMFFALVMIAVPFVAHSRKGYTTDKSFKFVLIGSIVLVISNSIAGIDRFGVMSNLFTAMSSIATYCAAHWLIVHGIISHPTKEKTQDEFALPH